MKEKLATGTPPPPAPPGGDREQLSVEMRAIGMAARQAASLLARSLAEQKTQALRNAAAAIRSERAAIIEANRRDLDDAGDRSLSAAMLDRLKLDEKRIEAMAQGIEDVASLPDPVGIELARWTRPNGLDISRVSVPLGVIGV